MIDKQIIIDGVDVSGCEWFGQIDLDINVICTSNSPKKCNTYCKDIPNCYYKQLKRKEQKCEGLKRDLHKNFEAKNKLHLIIDRLLEASGYDTNTASAEDFEDVYENMRYEKQQLEQFGQTLTDIKEMLKDICMEECSFDWNKTSKKHCGDCDCRYGQILQKISKSEVDNDR